MSVPNLFTYTIRTDHDEALDEWQATAWREDIQGGTGTPFSIGSGPDRAPLVGRGKGLTKGEAIEQAVESFDAAAETADAFDV